MSSANFRGGHNRLAKLSLPQFGGCTLRGFCYPKVFGTSGFVFRRRRTGMSLVSSFFELFRCTCFCHFLGVLLMSGK